MTLISWFISKCVRCRKQNLKYLQRIYQIFCVLRKHRLWGTGRRKIRRKKTVCSLLLLWLYHMYQTRCLFLSKSLHCSRGVCLFTLWIIFNLALIFVVSKIANICFSCHQNILLFIINPLDAKLADHAVPQLIWLVVA